MSFCTLNGFPVQHARIYLPRVGVWHADIALEDARNPGRDVFLQAGDGALSLQGTVRHGASTAGSWVGSVVGGMGGMWRPMKPKQYLRAPLSVPLLDIVDAAGETLSYKSDTDVLGRVLPAWVVSSSPASVALTTLLNAVGASWRITANGMLWVGMETWPEARASGELLGEDPIQGKLYLSQASPSLAPGTSVSGQLISYVEHAFSADELRTTAWLEGQA